MPDNEQQPGPTIVPTSVLAGPATVRRSGRTKIVEQSKKRNIMPNEPTPKPLEITFTIGEGDAWIDPAGVIWYVKSTSGERVYFERTVVVNEDAKTVAQKWRKVEDKK